MVCAQAAIDQGYLKCKLRIFALTSDFTLIKQIVLLLIMVKDMRFGVVEHLIKSSQIKFRPSAQDSYQVVKTFQIDNLCRNRSHHFKHQPSRLFEELFARHFSPIIQSL